MPMRIENLMQLPFDDSPFDEVSLRGEGRQKLDDLRETAKERTEADGKPVAETAYGEALSVLARLSRHLPFPELQILDDGAVCMEWLPRKGLITVNVYGDGLVFFAATWGRASRITGVCELADPLILPTVLKMVSDSFRR